MRTLFACGTALCLSLLLPGCAPADEARTPDDAAVARIAALNLPLAMQNTEMSHDTPGERVSAASTATAAAAFGFGPHRPYPRSEGQGLADYQAVASGDFNGDARVDLVALTHANTVDLFLQRPEGGLAEPIVFRFGSASYPARKILLTDDFNGDHLPDVAFHTTDAQGRSGGVGLLLSRQGDTPVFRQAYADRAEADNLRAIDWASLDVDGDGFNDIVVARNEGFGFAPVAPCLTPTCPTIEVLHGDGAGNFGRARKTYLDLTDQLFQLVTEPLDDDRLRDLVLVVGRVTSEQPAGRVLGSRRLAGGGLGALQLLHSVPVMQHLYFGDITGDRRNDSVMGGQIHLRLENGQFGGTRQLAMQTGMPATPLLADLDNDEKIDLVNHQAANVSSTPYLAVYLQRDGTLQAPFEVRDVAMPHGFKISTGMSPYAAADWNSDGCTDLAVAAGYDGVVILDGRNCPPKPHPTGGNLPPRLR